MLVGTIWAEMARRKLQFHPDENWETIRQWGLFNWGDITPLRRRGLLLTDMKRENRVVWCRPSREAWEKHISPLIDKYSLREITIMAGWPDPETRPAPFDVNDLMRGC